MEAVTARRERSVVAPYVLWPIAMAGFAIACQVALPTARPEYDFVQGGEVVGHIIDRALLPVPVAQNGPNAWPVILAYFVAYPIAFLAYEGVLRSPRLRPALVAFGLGLACAIAVPLLITTDPYAYALYGLEAGPLGLNPYAPGGANVAATSWGHTLFALFPSPDAAVRVTNYGPAFALLYAGLAEIFSHATLGAFVTIERVCGALSVVATAAFLAYSVPNQRAAERLRRACAFAFHPLVLFEFVAFAHGDVFMLLALAVAYWCFRHERIAAAGAFCGLAACMRIVALFALGALVVAAFRRGRGAAGASLAGAFGAIVVLGAISHVRFGSMSLGGPPVLNAYSAPLVALAYWLGGSGALRAGLLTETCAGVALGAVMLVRVAHGRPARDLQWLPLAALVAAPSFFPQYATWFVSLRGLTADPRFVRVARALSFSAPLSYVVHIDPFPAPGVPPEIQIVTLAAVWIPVLVALARLHLAPVARRS